MFLRKILGALCALALAPWSAFAQNAPLTESQLLMLTGEARFSAQDRKPERNNKNKPLTVDFIVRELTGESLSISKMVVATTVGHDITTTHISGSRKCNAYEVLPAHMPQDGFITLSLWIDKENFQLVINLQPIAEADGNYYVKANCMLPQKKAQDDRRSTHSDCTPITGVRVFAYDATSPNERIKTLAEINITNSRKIRANERLTDVEMAIVNAMTDKKTLAKYIAQGTKLFVQGRYDDACRSLERAYNFVGMKYEILNEAVKKQLLAATKCLAVCKHQLGEHEEAYFYMSGANIGEGLVNADTLQLFRRLAMEAPANEYGADNKNLTLGYVMGRILSIRPQDVKCMVAYNAKKQTLKSTDANKIMSTKMADLCKDDYVVHINYGKAGNSAGDASSLCTNNEVIVYVTKLADSSTAYRFNFLKPQFANDLDLRGVYEETPVENYSFVVDQQICEAQMPNTTSEMLRICEDLHNGNLYVNVMHRIDLYRIKMTGDNESYNMGFYYGFAQLEMNLRPKAMVAYEAILPSKDAGAHIEYVNSLQQDMRCSTIIEKFSQKANEMRPVLSKMTGADFKSFAMRRRAFALVEMEQYDQAEVLLKEMKKDPKNRKFAENELQYINQIRMKKME